MTNPFDLSGRNALVTGGSRGIGAAAAHALDLAGCRVALVARSTDQLDGVAAGLSNDTVAITADLSQDGEAERIASGRGLLRLPGHSAAFSAAETAMWREVLGRHEDGPPRPILVAELARELHRSEATIRTMLLRRRTSGDIWQITETRFLLPGHVADLAAIGGQLDSLSSAGFSPAQFRDASGMGRNFVIQLLEFFDRIGVTRRQGEVRRMRTDYEAAVGDAASLATPRVLP